MLKKITLLGNYALGFEIKEQQKKQNNLKLKFHHQKFLNVFEILAVKRRLIKWNSRTRTLLELN